MKLAHRTLFGSLLAIILLACSSAFAQQTGMSGVITDIQGGLIQGAKVEAKEVDGSSFYATTNAQGVFVLPSLVAAEYTVKIEMSGFATVQKRVLLLVGQVARVDVILPIAANTTE